MSGRNTLPVFCELGSEVSIVEAARTLVPLYKAARWTWAGSMLAGQARCRTYLPGETAISDCIRELIRFCDADRTATGASSGGMTVERRDDVLVLCIDPKLERVRGTEGTA